MNYIKNWNINFWKTIPEHLRIKYKKALRALIRMQKSKLFPYSIK